MKIFGTVLGTVLGLGLLALLLVGAYLGVRYVSGVYAALGGQAGTLAAIGSLVALLCAGIVAEGLKGRGHSGALAVERSEKAALYEELLGSCIARLRDNQGDGRLARDDAMRKSERQLALRGGGKVIAAYVRFRSLPGSADDNASALLKTLAIEMRSDLGSSDAARRGGDLLALLLAEDRPVGCA